MTLPSSGIISFSDIQGEFGGSNPISLSEYYAGAGLVPSGTGSIPSSGQISISQFFGTSAVRVSLTSRGINATVGSGTASVAYVVSFDKNVYRSTQSGSTILESWLSAGGNPADYDVMATLSSGVSPTGTLNTWLNLGSVARSWGISTPSGDRTSEIFVQIRKSSTGVVLASATITMDVTSG